MKPMLKILALSLHGQNGDPGRERSMAAFLTFKVTNCPTANTYEYFDAYGFPVFCVLLIVTELYKPGTLLSKWETICKTHGVEPADSDEVILDFKSAVFGYYVNQRDH